MELLFLYRQRSELNIGAERVWNPKIQVKIVIPNTQGTDGIKKLFIRGV